MGRAARLCQLGCALTLVACGGSNDSAPSSAQGAQGGSGGADAPTNDSPTVAWTAPLEGATVFGIVELEVVATDDDGVESVTFHVDARDPGHQLGEPVAVVSSTARTTWFTQDTGEGARTLYATARDKRGTTKTVARTFQVHNVTRAEAVGGAVKQTPALDAHPPVLDPAFAWRFHEPEPLAGAVNTAGGEDSPFITADGQDLYFWFTPVVTADLAMQQADGVTGIWHARREAEGWAEPRRVYLSYHDEPVLDGAPTVLGSELWFASARAGGVRSLDIWVAHHDGAHWTDWKNAGQLLNGNYEIGELHLTGDGSTMYFDSERAGGKGEKDIWMTHRGGASWEEPVPIDAVNTEASEGWPYVSADGTELWFTRLDVAPELWMSQQVDGAWQPPVKVLDSLAGEPTFDEQGNLYFVHHYWSDAQQRMLESDIYVCRRR